MIYHTACRAFVLLAVRAPCRTRAPSGRLALSPPSLARSPDGAHAIAYSSTASPPAPPRTGRPRRAGTFARVGARTPFGALSTLLAHAHTVPTHRAHAPSHRRAPDVTLPRPLAPLCHAGHPDDSGCVRLAGRPNG